MKTKLILAFAAMISCFGNAWAQIDTSWVRTWDSQFWDEAHAVTTDDSNNVYVAGWSYEWGANYDFIFAKYDAAGNYKWSKVINYTSGDQARKVLYDHQGHIYIGGFVNGVYSTTGGQFCLMKYSTDGDSLWQFVDNNTSVAIVNDMAMDDSGNVILAGYDQTSLNSEQFSLVKVDTGGVERWFASFNNMGPNQSNLINSIVVDHGGNIYVTGTVDDTVNFYTDIITIKYSPLGDTLWKRIYNGPANYYDYGIKNCIDSNGDIMVAGTLSYHNPYSSDMVLLKYDSLGNLLTVSTYDYQPATQSFDAVVDVKADAAGNVYVLGQSSSDNSQGTMRVALLKYDVNGDTVWTVRWGQSGDKQPRQLFIDTGANLYVAGYNYNSSFTGYDGMVFRFDSSSVMDWMVPFYGDSTNVENEFYAMALDKNNDLVAVGRTHATSVFDFLLAKYRNSVAGIQEQKDAVSGMDIFCYPNPFADHAVIRYFLADNSTIKISVLDLNGREVQLLYAGSQGSGEHMLQLNAASMNSGIYLCRIADGNTIRQTKMLIIK
jgi:hypothetical protein